MQSISHSTQIEIYKPIRDYVTHLRVILIMEEHRMTPLAFTGTMRKQDKEHYQSSEIIDIVCNNTKGDVTFFQAGDILSTIKCGNKTIHSKAPLTGYYSYLVPSYIKRETDYPFYYFPDESDAQYYGYKFECSVEIDPFTSQSAIRWRSVFSFGDTGYYLGDIWIQYNIKDDLPAIVFSASNGIIKKGDLILMSFNQHGETKILEFPVRSVYQGPRKRRCADFKLSYEDLLTMSSSDFIACRIQKANGDSALTFSNTSRKDDSTYRFILYTRCYLDLLIEQGIDYCSATGMEDVKQETSRVKEPCYVYLMKDLANGFHKIGISNHPEYREHTLQSEKPTIELVTCKEYPTRLIAEAIELALHKAYSEKRLRGEWFDLSSEDVDDIVLTLR